MKWTIQEGANSHIFDCRIFCEKINDVIAFCDNDNAALICAAPELLEALEVVQNSIETTGLFLNSSMHEMIKQAIAKAKQLTNQP